MTPSEPQVRAFKAYKDNGLNVKATAKELGITVNNLKKTLFNAHHNGLTIPTQYCKHLPAGMELNASSIYVSKNGEVSGWYKGSAFKPTTEQLEEFYNSHIPTCKIDFPTVKATNENLMLEWPIYDMHHGMLAWAKETGNDYDHKISKHLQISAGKILYATFGAIKKAVIILGGDNQTADNRQGKTEKSGNVLDTDTRYPQMAWSCYEAAVTSIETAAQFAESVYVIVLSGNHDYHAAIHLTISLNAYFRNVDKVEIDVSPERHRFYSWGKRVVMATHGDVNEKRIGPFALQRAIRKGYASDPGMRLHVLMGHIHKPERKTPEMLTQEDGIFIERFPTLAAQEAYSIEGAYTSCRATEATLWHKKNAGRYGSREITVGEILERYPIEV